jgi:streptogramin lyase
MSVERHRGSGQEELGRFDISGERMIRLAESNDGTTWWTDSDKQLATCCRDGRSPRIALGGRPTQIVAGTDAHVVVDDDGEQELFRMAPGGITERWALGRLQHVVEVTLDDNVAYATLDGAVVRVGDRGVPLAEAT